MLAGLMQGRGRRRRAVPPVLRRLRVRRHRRAPADAHVRRPARPRGRRPGGRADRGRPGAHRRRRARLRARTRARSSPATSCSSAARRSCGPDRCRNWVAACDLMLGLDIDTVVPGHGPVTDKSGVAEVRDYLAFVDEAATARQARGRRRVGGGARHRHGDRGQPGVPDAGARPGASPSTSTRCTAPSIPAHRSANVVEQFRRMAELEAALSLNRRRASSRARDLPAPAAHALLDALVGPLDHLHAGQPLLLAGRDVPRRQLVVGAGEHVLGGLLVLAVALAVAPVLVGELPALERIVLAASSKRRSCSASLICSQNLMRITPSWTSVVSKSTISW